MGYDVKNVKYEEACQQAGEYDFALIYGISGITLCPVSELEPVDWGECLEARFFSSDRELHIFDREGEMEAVEIKDAEIEPDENLDHIRKYQLNDARFTRIGTRLCVKEYMKFDKDGQIYVALTRLCGVE